MAEKLASIKKVGGGGGSINPQTIAMSNYNVGVSGTPISVTSGKTYVFCFITEDNRTDVSVTNGTILYKQMGNGDSWSSRVITSRLVVFKANLSTITVVCTAGVYGFILAQLD